MASASVLKLVEYLPVRIALYMSSSLCLMAHLPISDSISRRAIRVGEGPVLPRVAVVDQQEWTSYRMSDFLSRSMVTKVLGWPAKGSRPGSAPLVELSSVTCQ